MAPTHNQGVEQGTLPWLGCSSPGLGDAAWLAPISPSFPCPQSNIFASALRDGEETFKHLVLDEQSNSTFKYLGGNFHQLWCSS